MKKMILTTFSQPINQEPRCKQTGYGGSPVPEPKDSDCSLSASPQSGGESDPYSIEVEKYRIFVSHHPNQRTYYQPILDVLEYRPSNLEAIEDVVMVEGKNDFYVLSYFQDIIIKSNQKISLLPGTGSGSLDTAIQLYYAWGRKFCILLDSDQEGKKQKKRYQDLFGTIVINRIFILEDIDPAWAGCATEKILTNDDVLTIQKSVFPDKKKFNKKLFNLAIQENFVGGIVVTVSQTTIDRFNKLLGFLCKSLQ
jgi:5S rRNA maturation endonuclease (ribonuclease M5)